MSSNKQKSHENNQRTVSRKKVVPVAEDSRQAKPPGAGPGNKGAAIIERGSLQAGSRGPEVGERGGPGAQQTGWSSRQQAERIEARAEEVRRGLPQKSGYGGLEQDQHAGSQESPTGPPGSQQTSAKLKHVVAGAPAHGSKRGGSESKQ
jgi:hypothetical protein